MKYFLVCMLMSSCVFAQGTDETPLRVGILSDADGNVGVCFSAGFLDLAAREMQQTIERELHPVRLDSDELFAFPFVVLSGEGVFEWNEAERNNLRNYLDHGGFLLASAGCSNIPWARSFEAEMQALYPDLSWQVIEMDHPLFHSVYDIDSIEVKKQTNQEPAILTLSPSETVGVVYSPLGLNDTAQAGEGCCCCGGNEVRNAREINVNILAYALTH